MRQGLKDSVDKMLCLDLVAPCYTEYLPEGAALCQACRAVMDGRWVKEQVEMWNALPEVFGIEVPGWGEPAA